MKLLEERILKDGVVRPGGILKVDSFLNHQIDAQLLYQMALDLKKHFEGKGVNKILTIEASGIAVATMAGYVFDCPLVFAKKSKSRNISDNIWSTKVLSFTKGITYDVVVSKEYLGSDDKVLIVDDFLASGSALTGLCDLCSQAGAEIIGCGIEIEKVFQGGGAEIRSRGIDVYSLAMIKSMSDTDIEFM